MFTTEITYEDFDGNQVTDKLYFNITKTELLGNPEIERRVTEWKEMLEGDPRDLTKEEVRKLLDLVRYVMEISYGERSEDGKRFIKTPEVWANFSQSAASDAFLWECFTKPEGAVNFIVGAIPQDLRAEAEANLAVMENGEEKDPQNMTQEELLAAYRAKLSQ